MFTPSQQNINMSWPRPFVVGFILLMVFLSMSGDGPSNLTTDDLSTDAVAATAKGNEKDLAKTGVKEQIIYDLSLSNEKLEQEIKKYRQYVLDLRRAVRNQPGCSLEDNFILTLYPELHEELDIHEEESKGKQDGTAGETSSKEATSGVSVGKQEKELEQADSSNNSINSKQIDSAAIRLQNGRLSKDNSSTNLP